MDIIYYDIKYIGEDEYIFCFDNNNLVYLGLNNIRTKAFEKLTKGKVLKEKKIKNEKYKLQLLEYFQGTREHFSIDFKLIGTDFQKKVWEGLLSIKYGEIISYLDLAKSLDIEKSVRAVANAVAQNPLLIVVPCHRVIGIGGKLCGYRDGIDMKKKLIELESKKKLK